MPHEETGPGDLIEWRLHQNEMALAKLREEHEAHAHHCEIGRREIWIAVEKRLIKDDLVEIKAEQKSMKKALERLAISTAESKLRLSILVAVVAAGATALMNYGMKHLP